MIDTIYRQAAIDALFSLRYTPGEWVVTGLSMCVDALRNVPSAQPKKGKWNFIGNNMFECSMCGVLYTTEQLNSLRNYNTDPYLPWFCPHCGSDMRGEENV